MRHFGDITKLSGYTLPLVDVITGGSPCQDLSIAGARAGLSGERSGLFMEQIRLIKEMRSRDVRIAGSNQLVRLPRFAILENVPGAFSSNKGKDFQAVLLIAQKSTIKRRIVYRGAVYNALEAERINHLEDILSDRYKEGFHDRLKRALEILANDVKDVEGEL